VLLGTSTYANLAKDTSSFRYLKTSNFTLGLFTGIWYNSLEWDFDTDNFTVDGNFIWGAIYVITGSYPVNWQGYWAAHVESDRHINPDGINWAQFNVSASSSFVGTTFLAVLEKDVNGLVVNNVQLSKLWLYNKTASNELSNTSAGIHASVFDHLAGNIWVKLTYILVDHAEILILYGDDIQLVPKGVESIIEIKNWPYQNKSNTLTLVMAAGSAGFSLSASGQVVYSSITGTTEEQVYFRVSDTAYLNGKKSTVQISSNISSDITGVGTIFFMAQLQARYKSQASCAIYSVQFPPGASDIIYDPTMGSGESPYPLSHDNIIMIIILVSVCCVLLVGLAIVLAYFYFQKKKFIPANIIVIYFACCPMNIRLVCI